MDHTLVHSSSRAVRHPAPQTKPPSKFEQAISAGLPAALEHGVLPSVLISRLFGIWLPQFVG